MGDGVTLPQKPVIMLIGGVPGVGKTSISGHIAKKLNVDIVISGDYLREFIRPVLSGKEHDVMELSVYDAWQNFGDKNRENILRGYLEQSRIMWLGMEKVLSRAMSNGESLIIETLYFVPSLLEELRKKGLYSAYLYIADEKLHASRLLERQSFTHFNSPGERLAGHLEEYRTIMDYTVQEIRNKSFAKVYDNEEYTQTRDEMLKDTVRFFDSRVS